MGLNFTYLFGQTPLDEDEKLGLRLKSVTTQAELDEFEQLNIEKALEWSFRLKISQFDILSENFIKKLHKRMFGEVWNWAGSFRQTDKNIGIHWVKISVALKMLMDDVLFWISNKTYPPDEIALRFKHRLVSIHCFPNGNGRHSRIMADIIRNKIFNKDLFNWSASQNVKDKVIRKQYIDSLKAADNGDIKPLISFAS